MDLGMILILDSKLVSSLEDAPKALRSPQEVLSGNC